VTNHQPGVKVPVYAEDLIFSEIGSPSVHSNPTQRAISIRLPMRIKTSSKKHTALNLNVYRNLHHRSHHALKKKFEELAATLLKDTPPLGRIRLHYSVCPQTKRRLDIANVCSVIDKYFSDALTANGIIEDDDYTRLDFVSFGFGGLAKEEHVLVTITEIEERDPMKLSMTATLSADDITQAIAAWVAEETGQDVDVANVTIDEGVTATVEVGGEPTTTTTKPARKKRRTKAQIEADKAAEEAEQDEQTGTSGPDGDSTGPGEPAEEQAEEASNEAPEAEVEESAPAEDKQPKNASEESPEESSTTDGDSEEDAPAPVKKRKKTSIFDQ